MRSDALDRQRRIAALGFDYAAQPQEHVEACNLCGGHRFELLTCVDRYGYPARCVCCTRCALVFLDPRMTPQAYAAFYDGAFRPLVSAYHGRRIDADSIQEEQARYAEERGAFLAPFVPTVAHRRRLLDVGGSTGVVAACLAGRFAMEATVLDPAPSELVAARARGLEVVKGLVEDWDPGARRFDLVTLCQSVDHLLDVSGSLRRLRSLLVDDGRLFVDIVDLQAACLRHARLEEVVKIDHPFYLTEATMSAFLSRAGFEILGRRRATDGLHVGYACRLAEAQPRALPSREAVRAQRAALQALLGAGP